MIDMGCLITPGENRNIKILEMQHQEDYERFIAGIEELENQQFILHIWIHGFSGGHKEKTFTMIKDKVRYIKEYFPNILWNANKIIINMDANLPLTLSNMEAGNSKLIEETKKNRAELLELLKNIEIIRNKGQEVYQDFSLLTCIKQRENSIYHNSQFFKKDIDKPKTDENMASFCICKTIFSDRDTVIYDPIATVLAKDEFYFGVTLNQKDPKSSTFLYDHSVSVLTNYKGRPYQDDEKPEIFSIAANQIFLGAGDRGLNKGGTTLNSGEIEIFDSTIKSLVSVHLQKFLNTISSILSFNNNHFFTSMDLEDIRTLRNIEIKIEGKEHFNTYKEAVSTLYKDIFKDEKFKSLLEFIKNKGGVAGIKKDNRGKQKAYFNLGCSKENIQQPQPTNEELTAVLVETAVINTITTEDVITITVNKLIIPLIEGFCYQSFAGFSVDQSIIDALSKNPIEVIGKQLTQLQVEQFPDLLNKALQAINMITSKNCSFKLSSTKISGMIQISISSDKYFNIELSSIPKIVIESGSHLAPDGTKLYPNFKIVNHEKIKHLLLNNPIDHSSSYSADPLLFTKQIADYSEQLNDEHNNRPSVDKFAPKLHGV